MPKATISFKLPEENEEYELANNARKMYSALWDISQKMFRPNRKYGYPDGTTMRVLAEHPQVKSAIEELEQMFYGILNENDIEL